MRRHLSLLLKIVTILAIVVFLIAIYVTSQKQDAIKKDLKALIALQSVKPKDGKDASIDQVKKAVVEYITSNPVKNGRDGKSVTDEQVKKAVDNYFSKHPVKNGEDGKNGTDGKVVVQKIRCNTEENRWEVRYSPSENWQLLNGESVKCTIGGGDETNPADQR